MQKIAVFYLFSFFWIIACGTNSESNHFSDTNEEPDVVDTSDTEIDMSDTEIDTSDTSDTEIETGDTNNINDIEIDTNDTEIDSDIVEEPIDICRELTDQIVSSSGNTLLVSPAGFGLVHFNGSTTTLRNVILNANSGDTILLEDGTYTFAESDGENYTGIYVTTPEITIRSLSGDPNSVILDSNYVPHGDESGLVTIAAPNVTISGMTLSRSIFHLIHIWNGGNNVHIHNVRLIDGGQQFLKTSPGGDNRIQNGQVTCSDFIMTASGRENVWGYGESDGYARCYSGGIDTHQSDNWLISDNFFSGIYCDSDGEHPVHGRLRGDVQYATYQGGLAEHAIHMWDSAPSSQHIIERNLIVNCARGIGLGLGDTQRVYGGVVRNNMIFSQHAGSSEHDVPLIIEGAQNVEIYNNTVFSADENGYANAIEYRFSTTNGVNITNNLTNREIRSRQGGDGTIFNNVTTADPNWFVDASNGDLHLSRCDISEINDAGTEVQTLNLDFDRETRSYSAPDIGADECQ